MESKEDGLSFWRTILGPPKPQMPEIKREEVREYPKVNVEKYITSSINFIPINKRDKELLRAPFTVAVTPIISDPENIPKMEYSFEEAPKCGNCGTICNAKTIIFNDSTKYLCGTCKAANEIPIAMDEKFKSNQFHVNMVEYPYTDQALANAPIKNIFVLEKSELTVNHGLFSKTIEKLINRIKTLKSGYFSFILLTNTLTVPKISEDRTKFAYSSYPDCFEMQCPSADSIFFDLSTEQDLLIQYITSISELSQGTISSSLFELIDSIGSSYAGQNVMTTICTSTIPTGTMEEAKELGHKLLLSLSHFDLFIMNPSIDTQPDYASVGELSMLNNSHINIFNPVQVESASDDIIYRIFCQKCPAALVSSTHPPFLAIKDIKGCGMMRTQNSFIMTAAEPGDTFFFFYDYIVDQVEFTNPSILYQMRLTHDDGSTSITVATYSFSLVNNNKSVMDHANIDLILQSYIIQAIEDGREKADELVMLSSLDKIRDDFLNQPFLQLMLTASGNNNFRYACVCFGTASKLLNFIRASDIMSKMPREFGWYCMPRFYWLQRNTTEVPNLLTLNGFNRFVSGAMFIKYDSRHSLIILAENEDMNEWIDLLNKSPLKEVIQQISTTPSVELIHPKVNATHKTYITINKCMTAPLPATKKD